MKKYSIFLVLLLSFSGGCINVDIETILFEGYITDENDLPLSGVDITVHSYAEMSNEYHVQSDTNGYYRVEVETRCTQWITFTFDFDGWCPSSHSAAFRCGDNSRYDLQVDTSGCP